MSQAISGRRCLSCGAVAPIAADQPIWPLDAHCPVCTRGVAQREGIASFAPELADTISGFDPKAFDERSFVSVQAPSVIVPPNSFALARSIEYFKIPRDVLTICVGKSTYARCGIIVNVTPFEPQWEGFVTLEISNTTPLPARVYANEGLCQILFFQSDEVCEVSYADRKGKYQNQQGIVLPKL